MRDRGGWPRPIDRRFFIYGFIVSAHAGLQERIEQQHGLSLALGVIAMAVLFAIWDAALRSDFHDLRKQRLVLGVGDL